ncbi:MAG: CDP-glucose 4,6-dehydratase [Prochlorococcus marinus CUG1437]|nr:CDP-glucose 4,6-dehydratase [Prochlorococcus marinus CUG1437]
MDFDIFKNKKIIVTGHTGFKGSWLVTWLRELGADLVGISLEPSTNPSHFELLKLRNSIKNNFVDIRNNEKVKSIFEQEKPEFVFHLAAQPLVRYSYENPYETWTTNTIGTISILEALKNLKNDCTAIIITSDKCYKNVEWTWGYRENDSLGGSDPYSASKGAAELAISSYFNSFFKSQLSNINICSVRAGNVVGGGDWAKDRIVPDAARAWINDNRLSIRNPSSTRPWQHVLEPIGGYLLLASSLYVTNKLNGEAFNFGPSTNQNRTVQELITKIKTYWPELEVEYQTKTSNTSKESQLLKLCIDKALHLIGWSPLLDFEQTIKLTGEWFQEYKFNRANISNFTSNQIRTYSDLLLSNGLNNGN